MNDMTIKGPLVDARGLLQSLFDEGCCPSLRWIRQQTKDRTIPHIRIGKLVFFDVEMVRSSLKP